MDGLRHDSKTHRYQRRSILRYIESWYSTCDECIIGASSCMPIYPNTTSSTTMVICTLSTSLKALSTTTRMHSISFEMTSRTSRSFLGALGSSVSDSDGVFEFITKDRLEEEDHEGDILERWIAEAGESAEDLARGAAEVDHTGNAKNHEDSVFMRSYIPRTLNEVYDPERDIDVLKGGEGNKLIYAHTIELVEDASTESGESEVEETEQGPERREPRGHRHEDREAKKERKKAVKAEAREKRKNKMPKAEKRRRIKKHMTTTV